MNAKSIWALGVLAGSDASPVLGEAAGPPRDEHGRFAAAPAQTADEPRHGARTSAYDGGVRLSVPPPRDPEREHGQLVLALVAQRRLYGGDPF